MGEIEQMEVEIDALAQTLASTAAALKAARAERDAATARAEAAEQRAEAAEREVARLRSVIAEAVAELPVWPEGAYQTPMERDVSGLRARLLAALAEAQPAGEVADGCRPEDGL